MAQEIRWIAGIATRGVLLAFLASACGTGSIRYATTGEGNVTPDGLHRVQHPVGTAAQVFVRPDTHLGSYSKLMLDTPTLRARRQGLPENAAHEIDLLTRDFQEAFEEELRKSSRYAYVSEPGPGVLRIEPHLLDLQLLVPTRTAADRSDTFVQVQGAVTLLLEISDSQSREMLVRASERQAIQNPGGGAQELGPTATTADARFLFHHWARMLRGWLDDVSDIPPLPAPVGAPPSS
jgi:hypothetical protein